MTSLPYPDSPHFYFLNNQLVSSENPFQQSKHGLYYLQSFLIMSTELVLHTNDIYIYIFLVNTPTHQVFNTKRLTK